MRHPPPLQLAEPHGTLVGTALRQLYSVAAWWGLSQRISCTHLLSTSSRLIPHAWCHPHNMFVPAPLPCRRMPLCVMLALRATLSS